MKKPVFSIVSVVSIVLLLAACAPATTVTPIPPVVLDTSSTSAPSSVKASAEVAPAQEASLSFIISGVVEDVAVQEGERVQAGQALITLDMTEQEFAVVGAEAALRAAEINAVLQRYRRRYTNSAGKTVYLSGPREKILIADSKVEQAQAALNTAKATLAQGTLLAPFDGSVVAVNVLPGEYVQTSQVIIVLADLKNFQIETTDLSELNVAAVEIGQSATVFVEALNEEFPGKVTAISPISDTIGGDVVFKVTIQLDDQPAGLLWGMSADVEIKVE